MVLPYVLTGEVVHGRSLGNTYDSPTANITPKEDIPDLPFGVYYSSVSIDGKEYPAITNLGVRPTVSDDGRVNAETFIYDYDNVLYGKTISVKLLGFRRKEQRFSDVEELYKTVRLDLEEGRKYHGLASFSMASV